MSSSAQQYADNGLVLSKASLAVGDEILISYSGLLAGSGADQVFAHVGYGESWESKEFILMKNEGGAFKAAYKVMSPGILNISFKDSANNWDNNSSNNYSFKVSEKAKKAAVQTAEVKKTASKEKADAGSSAAKAAADKKATVAKKPAAASTKAKKTTDKEKAPAKKKEK